MRAPATSMAAAAEVSVPRRPSECGAAFSLDIAPLMAAAAAAAAVAAVAGGLPTPSRSVREIVATAAEGDVAADGARR